MKFDFSSGKAFADAIFTVRQIQKRCLAKKKESVSGCFDLEKEYDRVPWELEWLTLRRLGAEEWVLSVIGAMHEGVTPTRSMKEKKAIVFK